MTTMTHDVEVLHDKTGAPVDECRRALEASSGDVDQAGAILAGSTQTLGDIARAAVAHEAARHVIYLVGDQRVGVVPTDQAELMLSIATDLQAQAGKMTERAAQLTALVAFADRMREAMAAAAGSAVRLDVTELEEQIATYLLTQARARAEVLDRTRYQHVCQTCGRKSLSNPLYERHVEKKRKVDAATRGIGIAVLSGGMASPIIMANSLFAFRTQRPDHHCRFCQGEDTEQSVVVFCPNCKALYDKPMLRRCTKCDFDFCASVDLSDLWHEPGDVVVPATAGTQLAAFQLDASPTMLSFLPAGRHLVAASAARSVQLWEIGPNLGATAPVALWAYAVGGVVRVTDPIVAVSPDGRWVAAAKPQVPQVHVLRSSDGAEVATFKWALADGATPNGLTFWPDSSAVVIANAYVEIWPMSGQRSHRMKLGAVTMPDRVACRPDGRFIVASAGTLSNNKLFVWSGSDCSQVAKHTLHGTIADLAWSPQSAWLAIAIGNEAQLLDLPAGTVVARFPLDAPVTGVAVSPHGSYLAVASRDHSARVFDLRSGAEAARISRPVEVSAVAFAPDGRLAVGDAAGAVQLWAPPT